MDSKGRVHTSGRIPRQMKVSPLWRGIGGVVLFSLLGGAALTILIFRAERARAAMTLAAQGQPACDRGLSAAKSSTQTAPQQLNSFRPPGPAPDGMVWVPGGVFWMGSDEPSFVDARPWHRVYLDGYWIDKTEVTNTEFARFVQATKYVTVSERTPRAEDFPQAPPENLVAGSVVFVPPSRPVTLNDHLQWWRYIHGANWRHPEGSASDLTGREKHPVVHIAYEDAIAYCSWTHKRLPTEAEFEFAERGGLDRKRYAWGDEFRPGGKFMANTFQGRFPEKNTSEDGFVTTAPVASFPPNGYGIYDLAGNVWEWTSDWYRPDYYGASQPGAITRNPKGPADSLDPSEPGVAKKVQRGGSFLCTDQYCARYMAGGRGKGVLDTGTNHLGFRCVRDAIASQ